MDQSVTICATWVNETESDLGLEDQIRIPALLLAGLWCLDKSVNLLETHFQPANERKWDLPQQPLKTSVRLDWSMW